jgi:hypothetical protein
MRWLRQSRMIDEKEREKRRKPTESETKSGAPVDRRA